jgi:hypothetical protein
MTDILVDIDKLRSSAVEIDGVADEVNAAAVRAGKAALGRGIDSRYAAQLAGKLEGYGVELLAQASSIISGLGEHATWLRDLAQRFEEADQAAVEGMDSLWAIAQATLVEYGESPYVSRWLLDGSRPPWMDPKLWRHLTEEDREQIIRELRWDWANFMAGRTEGSFRPAGYGSSYYEEMFQIYLFGLPAALFQEQDGRLQQVAPYVADHALFSKPELPDGSDPDVYPGRDFRMWQYQDLEAYVDALERSGTLDDLGLTDQLEARKTAAWAIRHYNLCGLDAAGQAVGVSNMMEAYVAFAGIDEQLLIKNETAWTWQIRDLYRELGWEADQIGRFASSDQVTWLHWHEDNRLEYPTFTDVEAKLGEGYVITPLVGINQATGVLSANPDASVGHFVNILETMTTKDGTEIVRVYNSAFHREEIYTWDQFDAIWRQAGGNSGGQAILARPPETQP